ncbi:hypothetical protein GF323_02315 [Candidatus Woesearchaeota archaeon]|nr:hypothetical protein [Candidatus Woesearchaeota archaeon]
MQKENALKIAGLSQLNKIDIKKFGCIYFGNEFCERKLPDLSFCNKIFGFCRKNSLTPVLLTPYLTDKGISKIEPLLKSLDKSDQAFEITVNDIGLLSFLQGNLCDNVKLNLGRLLIKMKKGPEIMSGVLNQDKEQFRQNSLQNPLFLEFYKKLGIKRFETDIPPQQADLPENENLSLYLGNCCISSTRRCIYQNCESRDYKYSISQCNEECLNYYIERKMLMPSSPYFILGNAEFLRQTNPLSEKIREKANRYVFFNSLHDLL